MRDKAAVDGYNYAIAQIDRSADPETIRLAELAALVQFTLGHPLDRPIFETLARSQSELHSIQDDLNAKLDNGEMTAEEHEKHVHYAMRVMIDRCRSILGEMQYQAMFGDSGLDATLD